MVVIGSNEAFTHEQVHGTGLQTQPFFIRFCYDAATGKMKTFRKAAGRSAFMQRF